MKLRFSLLLICLFCIGLFSEAQTAKKKATKPATESNVEEEIPVTITNTRHLHKAPPPPPPVIKKDKPAPPPPPSKPVHKKLPVPPSPETPPLPDGIV